MSKCAGILFAMVVCLSVPSAAAAHGGNNDPDAVHACIHNVNKNVRIVGVAGSCHVAESPAHWKVQGAPGTNGTDGTNGTNGTNGIDGTSVTFVGYFSGNQNGCPNGGVTYAAGNPPVHAYVCNGLNGSGDTRVFRYMTFDTYLETCCWMADNNPSLFGGVHPSTWTDGGGLASQMSSDPDVLRSLFVRKMYPGPNALVNSARWSDGSSTNGKVTAVLMRIQNNTSSPIEWTPHFYFTAYVSWGERASVALNGVNVWATTGNHHPNSTAAVTLTLPPNQTSTVIVVVPSSPQWNTSSGLYRVNLLAFYNNSLNLPAGLSFVDDLDKVTGPLW